MRITNSSSKGGSFILTGFSIVSLISTVFANPVDTLTPGSSSRYSYAARAVSKRYSIHETCHQNSPDTQQFLLDRFVEIHDMATAAVDAIEWLIKYQNDWPKLWTDTGLLGRSFHRIIDPFIQVFGNPPDGQALDNMNLVLKKYQSLQAIGANTQFDVVCDDRWLEDFDENQYPESKFMPDKVTPLSPGQRWFKDIRTGMAVGPSDEKLVCRYDTTLAGVLWQVGGQIDRMTLCPEWLKTQTFDQQLSEARKKTYTAQDKMHISTIRPFFSVILFHELGHSKGVMGETGFNDDSLTKDGKKAYDWGLIRQLALEDQKLAMNNSDSYALFATIMYLGNNNWGTGEAAPI